jgi:phenylacetate-CoA ligase
MASLILAAKRCMESIPRPLGKWAAYVPYDWRLGPAYNQCRNAIARFEHASDDERIAWFLPRLQRIVRYAYDNIPFYRHFYDDRGFAPGDLKRWDDWKGVPIVTRRDMQETSIDDRGNPHRGALLLNTGGTSGQPLHFYVDRQAFAREWAHMHAIWERLGYRATDLKITFRGKNLGRRPIRYNAVHNEYMVNAYAPWPAVAEALTKVAGGGDVRFIHGYPSAVAEFAQQCRVNHPDLRDALRRGLKGILLSSEYPAPIYRDEIDEIFQAASISWYGHSEMAVLAYETERLVYRPMQTYGLVEAIPFDDTHRLVGTSFDNTACPFIRYDTGDAVRPLEAGAFLRSFSVAEGRLGDFVTDASGKRIPLTALVFGRHHQLFTWAQFMQIREDGPGKSTVFVTVRPGEARSVEDARRDFDSANVMIDFTFELRQEPVRTTAGKVPFLVT